MMKLILGILLIHSLTAFADESTDTFDCRVYENSRIVANFKFGSHDNFNQTVEKITPQGYKVLAYASEGQKLIIPGGREDMISRLLMIKIMKGKKVLVSQESSVFSNSEYFFDIPVLGLTVGCNTL